MSRKIGDGRNLWRPGNEDLPMLVERLHAQREDRAWLSMPERPDTGPSRLPVTFDDTLILLPQLTDADYWSSALTLSPDWFSHADALKRSPRH
ncbi:MAG: hypothetical protein GY734_06255 [Herbaspirillum sp.]|jgi:hypothetical protein|uniref:hypothetical protein n=1 Tax=Herbaspirillum TaxID=963 RepID=UPI000C0A2ED7|nr:MULTISPECIES: hypothetical protein [Herbaspirillum]MAF04483.1 hypothetical protein [Herbaspirillum sp.]MBN9357190.1 hypothetical protein [Herbaspirillum huttiense]MBO14519.1 hypothetical protein [Herbaspirillum sp.]MBP1315379.1 hypothetical protein [Herbaspirillum sp. 1130]MCP3656001.1 hypothetical protein [Herbaspirillum sp.]|tara:strand:+ start:4812 stop:5090 length:279 start_codon:yes stop_codon:yes gene_type:complete